MDLQAFGFNCRLELSITQEFYAQCSKRLKILQKKHSFDSFSFRLNLNLGAINRNRVIFETKKKKLEKSTKNEENIAVVTFLPAKSARLVQ